MLGRSVPLHRPKLGVPQGLPPTCGPNETPTIKVVNLVEQWVCEPTGGATPAPACPVPAGIPLDHPVYACPKPDGTFDYWSPETFVIFDFDPSKGIPTLTQWLAALQPDGRDLLTRTTDKMFREGVRGDVRYWVDHPKKGKRMMHSTGGRK